MSYITGLLGTIAFFTLLNVGGKPERIHDRTIKGQTIVSSEWTEIVPDKPLKPEREQQEVVLYLEESYEGDFQAKGVRLPDGSLVTPEVQLIDMDGNIYTLKYYGFRGEELIRFTLRGQLSGREYRSVRIRSEKPIKCKEIIWSCFNWKDVLT